MSRDWTPAELYYADLNNVKNGMESFRTMNFTIKYKDDSFKMFNKERLALKKKYTELGFLFDDLHIAWKAMEEHPKYRHEILSLIEQHIKNIESNTSYSSDTDMVYLWFNGLLDKGFYYNKENNRIFLEYIVKLYYERVNNCTKQ